MKAKRILGVLASLMLMLVLLPATAQAATYSIADGASVNIGDYAVGDMLIIADGASVTLTGTQAVSVFCGAGVTLTLNNVTIDNNMSAVGCALSFAGGGNALKLEGKSTLKSSGEAPGVRVESGTTLTISDGPGAGIGELEATGGSSGAGIGGGYDGSNGSVTITGGKVTANGGENAAGIGGGCDGSNGSVMITGGTVTANGGPFGAGIGGGNDYNDHINGNGGNVTINGGIVTANGGLCAAGIGGGRYGAGGRVAITGGTVTAKGSEGGAGIGRGRDSAGTPGSCAITGGSVYVGSDGMGPTPTNGSANVYLTTVTLGSVTEETVVASLTTSLTSYTYGVSGMNTDGSGKLYLYLPDGTTTTAAQTASLRYGKNTVTTSSATPAQGTLYPPAFIVTGDTSGYTYGDDGVLTFTGPGDYTVSMATPGATTKTDRIVVNSGVTADITLNGVKIGLSSSDNAYAFNMAGATVNLYLEGESGLTSGLNKAGLHCQDGVLTIADGPGDGTGRLTATGGSGGPGVGGKDSTIVIESGTITATGQGRGAGIGGDSDHDATIRIEGGTVTAMGDGGAGIGGGGSGGNGTVTIKGGAVYAQSNNGGAGIGGGYNGSGTIAIESGTVNATGNNGGGAGIGNGLGSKNQASITISGGVVYASALMDGVQDIGAGAGSAACTLSISGTAAVFLKNDTSPAPTTTTHTKYALANAAEGDSQYGIPVPWAGSFSAWLSLRTLSYGPNNGAGTLPASVTQHVGTKASVAGGGGLSRMGYNFSGWNTLAGGGTGGTAYAAGDAFTFPIGTLTTTLYAQWSTISYTLSYDLGGGTLGTATNPATYTVESSDFTLTNPTKAGYDFAGWSGTGITGNPVMSVTIRKGSMDDRAYTAHWTAINYSITYTLNGGTLGTATNPATYTAESDAITLNNPTRIGYDFVGWTLDGNTDPPATTLTILKGSTGDRGYTAQWTAIPYTISYTLDGGTASPANPTGYSVESDAITLTNPTKAYYNFAGWTGTGIPGNPVMSVTIPNGSTGDRAYTAHWTEAFVQRTLTDPSTGVTVSGLIRGDAVLVVQNLTLGDDAACRAIRQRMNDAQYVFLLGWDISLTQHFTGTLAIAIPVGARYNGMTVTILHCASGVLESFSCVVRNGVASISVTSLSPFVAFAVTEDVAPDRLPVVVTNAVSGITTSGATLNGTVAYEGTYPVTERGFVYTTSASGGLAIRVAVSGKGKGSFSAVVTGLDQYTTYYVRAYATNAAGTSYGTVVGFRIATTNPTYPPQTGDENTTFGFAMLAVGAAGIAALIWRRKRRA